MGGRKRRFHITFVLPGLCEEWRDVVALHQVALQLHSRPWNVLSYVEGLNEILQCSCHVGALAQAISFFFFSQYPLGAYVSSYIEICKQSTKDK